MSLYTWLSEDDLGNYCVTFDKEINEAMEKVRELNINVYIAENLVTVRSWFSKKTYPLYTIYIMTGIANEAHVINFYNRETGINTSIPKELVLAYLYGILTGKHF